MQDRADWQRELAAIQILVDALGQRQPEGTSLAALLRVIQYQVAIREDLQAIRTLLEALVARRPPQVP